MYGELKKLQKEIDDRTVEEELKKISGATSKKKKKQEKKRAEELRKSEEGAADEEAITHLDPEAQEKMRQLARIQREFSKKPVYPLITPEDEANNRKSMYRKLTKRLYLLVKKDRTEHAWQFPQGGYEEVDGNALRNTAERELKEELGEDLKTFFIGNSPCGYWTYPGKDNIQTKSFFFRAQYIFGKIKLNEEIVDHVWVTRDELEEYLDPEVYQYVRDLIME